jgi:hypothetical protein
MECGGLSRRFDIRDQSGAMSAAFHEHARNRMGGNAYRRKCLEYGQPQRRFDPEYQSGG